MRLTQERPVSGHPLMFKNNINKENVKKRLLENLKIEEYKDMYDEFLKDNLNV